MNNMSVCKKIKNSMKQNVISEGVNNTLSVK